MSSAKNTPRKKKPWRSFVTAPSLMRLLVNSRRIKLDRVSRYILDEMDRADFFCAGGSLGWKTKGGLDPAFENVAFELETSTTGNPKYAEVKTGFGYHIIMVEGRK